MAESSKLIALVLRGFEFLWALLVMALIGNMIASADNGNPSVVNFAMFCAVFGMLTLFYLIPATVSEGFQFHPILPIVLDTLNSIFYFCCAVALAAMLGAHSCSDSDYTGSNGITNGSGPGTQEKRCREAQASDAFLWFGFAAFAASAVLSGLGSGSANVRGVNPFMKR